MAPRPRLYSMLNWSLRTSSANRLVFRPSLYNVFWRGLFALLMGGILAAALYAYKPWLPSAPAPATPTPEQQELQRDVERLARESGVSEREIAHIKEDGERRRARHRAQLDSMRYYNRATAWFVAALLAAVGGLPLLTCAWSRVTLQWLPGQVLRVRQLVLLPHRRDFPVRDFDAVQYGVEEVVRRGRYRVRTDHFWRWFVRFSAMGPPHEGLPDSPTFHVFRQPDRPSENAAPPPTVTALLSWLRQRAGLTVRGPYVFEEEGRPTGAWGIHHKRLVQNPGPERVVRRQVHYQNADGSQFRDVPFEDLPPKVRARVEQMRRDMGGPHRFAVRGPDGVTRTYDSLEEMPAEIRRRFEEARRNR